MGMKIISGVMGREYDFVGVGILAAFPIFYYSSFFSALNCCLVNVTLLTECQLYIN